MADQLEDSARPAKRARLDDNSASTLAATPTPQPAPIAPKVTSTPAIDTDLEREVRAGITEYVCPDNLGFTGVLKQRYTDFLVNEIGLDGQVLHLRSMHVPKKEREKPKSNGAEARKENDSEVKVVVEENGSEAMVVDVQKVPVETEEDSTIVEQERNQQAEAKQEDSKQEEPKPEQEEEVGLHYVRFCRELY
jgi:tRNA pseudouridine13 synthase